MAVLSNICVPTVTEIGVSQSTVTEVKPLQAEKALFPIVFTELGIVTEVKPLL
jgi:hypothetical protein